MNGYTRSNAHTQILRTVKDFSRILSSWTRHRRNGVRFPKYPHGCSSRLRYSGPTFHFWTRWLVSWVVELGLTGPTSISTNIRTTCSKSLAVFVSNGSSLSVRPCFLKLNSPSQKWRAFPEISARLFQPLTVFRSNVPFLNAMARILNLIFL